MYLDSMLCYDCVIFINNCSNASTIFSRNNKRQKHVDGLQNSALIFVPRKGGRLHEVPESTIERYTIQISFKLKE